MSFDHNVFLGPLSDPEIVALGVTPLLYAGHAAIDRYLGAEEAHQLIERSAQVSEEAVL